MLFVFARLPDVPVERLYVLAGHTSHVARRFCEVAGLVCKLVGLLCELANYACGVADMPVEGARRCGHVV
jgi:hypothetical protein